MPIATDPYMNIGLTAFLAFVRAAVRQMHQRHFATAYYFNRLSLSESSIHDSQKNSLIRLIKQTQEGANPVGMRLYDL